MAAEAGRLAPRAERVGTLDGLLGAGLDGVVIATPSAMHAEQSIRSLERGAAVFCQKPLGRTEGEVRAAVDAARRADRLLAVDLSYRFTEGMRRVRDVIRSGELGRVYAADLVFHNAYGPDKPWFYDPALAGGGCVMDLGVHLVDLALWVLDAPQVSGVSSRLFAGGEPLEHHRARGGLRGRHSGNGDRRRGASPAPGLQAGCDAVIAATFYGTEGGAAFRNVDGSFFDFVAGYRGTARGGADEPAGRVGRAGRRGLGHATRGRRALRSRGGTADRRGARAGPDLRPMRIRGARPPARAQLIRWALSGRNRFTSKGFVSAPGRGEGRPEGLRHAIFSRVLPCRCSARTPDDSQRRRHDDGNYRTGDAVSREQFRGWTSGSLRSLPTTTLNDRFCMPKRNIKQ